MNIKIINMTFLLLLFSTPAWSQEPIMDFVPYCTYGVVTGVLVGSASLAISEDPGSSLTPIAKGASLGLYVGAAVGLYRYWTFSQRKNRIDFSKNFKINQDLNAQEDGKNKTDFNEKPEFMFIPDAQKISFLINWKF